MLPTPPDDGTDHATTLRLGVVGAVLHEGNLLFSRRGDLNVWALPGGRLDSGERLEDGVLREVWEETGLETAIIAPLGLYYLGGFRRVNALYLLRSIGGQLRGKTSETRENRFFPLGQLPRFGRSALSHTRLAEDVRHYVQTGERPPPRVLASPPLALWRLKWRLRLRYLENLARRRPEPRYPRFDVRAVALVLGEDGRVLVRRTAAKGAGEALYTLPRLRADGLKAPWVALQGTLADHAGIHADLHWAGVCQDAPTNRVRLIFAARADEQPPRAGSDLEWVQPRNAALTDDDARYLTQVLQTESDIRRAPVWSLASAPGEHAQAGDFVTGGII